MTDALNSLGTIVGVVVFLALTAAVVCLTFIVVTVLVYNTVLALVAAGWVPSVCP